MGNSLPLRVVTGLYKHHRIGDAGMAVSESQSGLNICLGHQATATVQINAGRNITPSRRNCWTAEPEQWKWNMYLQWRREVMSRSTSRGRRQWLMRLSVTVRACVYGLSALCVSVQALFVQNNLSFGGNWRNTARKIAETSTTRSLSPVPVDAEVLRNLAVTAKTLVYNRRTALCRRTTRMLVCQTGSGCLFVQTSLFFISCL